MQLTLDRNIRAARPRRCGNTMPKGGIRADCDHLATSRAGGPNIPIECELHHTGCGAFVVRSFGSSRLAPRPVDPIQAGRGLLTGRTSVRRRKIPWRNRVMANLLARSARRWGGFGGLVTAARRPAEPVAGSLAVHQATPCRCGICEIRPSPGAIETCAMAPCSDRLFLISL